MFSPSKSAQRYIAFGALNTLVTFLFYQIVVTFASPLVAFVVTWCLGIIFVVYFYPEFVFGHDRNRKSMAVTGISYLLSFLVGIAISGLGPTFGIDKRLIIVISIGITTLLNFALTRLLLRRLPGSP